MLKTALAAIALALSTAAALPAASENYSEPQGRFSVTVPDGWRSQPLSDQRLAGLIMISGRFTDTGALCLILSQETPETRSMPQEDLDRQFSEALTDDFWRSSMRSAKGTVTVEQTGKEPRRGRQTYFVIARYTQSSEKGDFDAKSKLVIHIVPGALHFVNCLTKYESFGLEEATLESVFASYQPGTGLVASLPQRAPASALLTLFAGPKFDGVSMAIAHDVPNLAFAGWRANTASLVVSGYGQWQICDGLNYSGNCMLVSRPSAAALGGRVLRIGSVRRYVDPRDPRNALGLIAEMASSQLATAVDRAVQSRSRR